MTSTIQLKDDIEKYRRRIIEQADAMENGWFSLYVPDVATYRIPRAPFEHWVLKGIHREDLALPWEPVCPQGLKMQFDNQYHSDFVIGGGIPIDDVYGITDTNVALLDAAQDLIERKMRTSCVVLSGSGSVCGTVVHPGPDQKVENGSIIVIPDGSVRYFVPMVSACIKGRGAVIMEAGGGLCHLVINGFSHDFKIVRVRDARKLYPEGAVVRVDCTLGYVKIY